MEGYKQALLYPLRLWSVSELLYNRLAAVPKEPGVYAWYFKQVPSVIPIKDLHYQDELALLYIGIAPSRLTSSTNLRKRLRLHIRRDASVSTLRLSLGCLLSEQLQMKLYRTNNGPSGRIHFGADEILLTNWLAENAFVTWFVDPQPWILEDKLIKTRSLPLNLRGNELHPFYSQLTTLRGEAKRQAKSLPSS